MSTSGKSLTETLRVFTDGTDTVAAHSLEDVPAAWAESYGVTFEDEMKTLDGWREVPGDKAITIRDADGHGAKETRTAAEWAAENGRGLICSTEF